jgi:hypothetical protein
MANAISKFNFGRDEHGGNILKKHWKAFKESENIF